MSSQALPTQAKELFRYLFEQASLGIAVGDVEGILLLANPALCSMLTRNTLCEERWNSALGTSECLSFEKYRWRIPAGLCLCREHHWTEANGRCVARKRAALSFSGFMKKRLKLHKGMLSIESQSKHGTTIHA
jgi:hypothetical protein